MSETPQSVKVSADDETQIGHYTNLARISHDADAFVLDFIVAYANPAFAKLVSRVVMSPGHAKRLARALTQNIASYEQRLGPIPEPQPRNPSGPSEVQ